MTRIMVVDDHSIFRQGIVSLLKPIDDIEIVAETGSGKAAVKIALNLSPDLIVMDLSLPDINGIEAAKMIKEKGINAEIILLTMHDDEGLAEMASDAGIKGYLLKDDTFDDLIYAIKAVIHGAKFTSPSLGKDHPGSPDLPLPPSPLTIREKEIVVFIAEGHTSKEIAKRLFISIKTVERHRTSIMQKLGFKRVSEIVRYAIKYRLIGL